MKRILVGLFGVAALAGLVFYVTVGKSDASAIATNTQTYRGIKALSDAPEFRSFAPVGWHGETHFKNAEGRNLATVLEFQVFSEDGSQVTSFSLETMRNKTFHDPDWFPNTRTGRFLAIAESVRGVLNMENPAWVPPTVPSHEIGEFTTDHLPHPVPAHAISQTITDTSTVAPVQSTDVKPTVDPLQSVQPVTQPATDLPQS